MNILIPAAGKGSRFTNSKYKDHKPSIKVDDNFMLVQAAKTLGFLGRFIFILRENEYRNSLVNSLQKEFSNCKIAVIDFDTDGAAETALIAKDLINNDDELVIANCDQIMDLNYWNHDVVLKQLRKFDAGVVVIESNDIKHSYASIDNNIVTEIQEKNVIGQYALTGIHYWKRGKDFITSTEQMIKKGITTNNEYYIGPTYNELISSGLKVGYHLISDKAFSITILGYY